jgi:hypothetical protein
MCPQFAFLLVTRVTTWLRLSQREEAWQTAEILILRHQLAVLQRRQARRPHLSWADRALVAALLSVIGNLTIIREVGKVALQRGSCRAVLYRCDCGNQPLRSALQPRAGVSRQTPACSVGTRGPQPNHIRPEGRLEAGRTFSVDETLPWRSAYATRTPPLQRPSFELCRRPIDTPAAREAESGAQDAALVGEAGPGTVCGWLSREGLGR